MDVWWQVLLVAIAASAVSAALAILYGTRRWRSQTGKMHAELEGARSPIHPQTVDFRELDGLPAPVQRYFRTVLTEGQPLIVAVSVEQIGTFNLGPGTGHRAEETKEDWRPFKATQRVTTARPGFVWDARIRMAPGVGGCLPMVHPCRTGAGVSRSSSTSSRDDPSAHPLYDQDQSTELSDPISSLPPPRGRPSTTAPNPRRCS